MPAMFELDEPDATGIVAGTAARETRKRANAGVQSVQTLGAPEPGIIGSTPSNFEQMTSNVARVTGDAANSATPTVTNTASGAAMTPQTTAAAASPVLEGAIADTAANPQPPGTYEVAPGTGGIINEAMTNPQVPNVNPYGQVSHYANSVSGHLDSLLDKDSRYMKSAETRGLQAANARGLLNSTMGVEAAEQARVNAALPIAQQDASQRQQLQQKGFDFSANIQGQYAQTVASIQANTSSNIAQIAAAAGIDGETKTQLIANLQAQRDADIALQADIYDSMSVWDPTWTLIGGTVQNTGLESGSGTGSVDFGTFPDPVGSGDGSDGSGDAGIGTGGAIGVGGILGAGETIYDAITGDGGDSGAGGVPTTPPGTGTAVDAALGGGGFTGNPSPAIDPGTLAGDTGGPLTSGGTAPAGTPGVVSGSGAGASFTPTAGAINASGIGGAIPSLSGSLATAAGAELAAGLSGAGAVEAAAGLGYAGATAAGGAGGAAVTGAAAGSAAPGLGAALPALAPAALALAFAAPIALGITGSIMGKAAKRDQLAPVLTNISNSKVQTVKGKRLPSGGIQGVPFSGLDGKTYVASKGVKNNLKIGDATAISTVYDPSTGKFGYYSPTNGFYTTPESDLAGRKYHGINSQKQTQQLADLRSKARAEEAAYLELNAP